MFIGKGNYLRAIFLVCLQCIKRESFKIPVLSFLLQATSMTLGFVTSFLLARALGSSGYGEYTYIFAWAILAASCLSACFDKMLTRQFARHIATGEREEGLLRGLWQIAWVSVCTVSLLGVLLCGVFAFWEGTLYRSSLPFFALMSVPLLAMGQIGQALVRGRGLVILAQVPDLLIRPLGLLLGVVICFCIDELSPSVVGKFQLVGIGLSFALTYYWVYQLARHWRAAFQYDWASWLPSFRWFALLGIVGLLNNRIDVLMLGYLGDSASVGIYNIAARFSDMLKMPLVAVNAVLAPQFAALFAQQKFEDIQKVARLHSWAALGIGFFIFVLFVLGGKYFLSCFGRDFIRGYGVLLLLSAGQLVNLACGSVGNVLQMSGYDKYVFWGVAWACLLQIILNYCLIPIWGIYGGAMASAVSVIFWNAFLTVVLKNKMNIRTSVW